MMRLKKLLFLPLVLLPFAGFAVINKPREIQIGDVIGSKEITEFAMEKGRTIPNTGKQVIKYAYIASALANEPNEIVEKRTSNAKTFSTDKPNEFKLRIIAGDPQYYRDDNGRWWQADYATTTIQNFPSLPKIPIAFGFVKQ